MIKKINEKRINMTKSIYPHTTPTIRQALDALKIVNLFAQFNNCNNKCFEYLENIIKKKLMENRSKIIQFINVNICTYFVMCNVENESKFVFLQKIYTYLFFHLVQ